MKKTRSRKSRDTVPLSRSFANNSTPTAMRHPKKKNNLQLEFFIEFCNIFMMIKSVTKNSLMYFLGIKHHHFFGFSFKCNTNLTILVSNDVSFLC